MYYIYILYSSKSGKYYVGHTDDVNRRLLEHNELSEHSYTSKFRPWILKTSLLVGNERGVAQRIERHIKRQKSRKYIEELIKRGSIDGLICRYSRNG